MRSDGDIVITTGLDNSKLVKQLDDLEKKLSKQEIDLKVTNVDYERAKEQLEDTEKEYQKNLDKINEINEKRKEQKQLLSDLQATKPTNARDWGIDQWREYNEQVNKLEDEIYYLGRSTDTYYENISKIRPTMEKQSDVVDKIKLKIEQQNNEIADTEHKIENVKNAMQQTSQIDMSKAMKKMGKNLEKVTKKVSRMGLTLLGVQTVYGMMSSAISRIKEDNKEFASFMQTISNMFDIIVEHLIAQILPTAKELLPTIIEMANIILNVVIAIVKLLLPVIKFVINAVKWLADQLGTIASDWFGIDMSVNNFSKGLDKANKKANKLRKQLMGFDEMNILNKDGTTGAVSGISGINIGTDFGTDKKDWLQIPKGLETAFSVGAGALTEDLHLFYKDQMKELGTIIESAIAGGRIREKDGIVEIITSTGQAIKFTKEEYDALVKDIVYGKIPAKNKNLWEKVKTILQNKNIKVAEKNLKSLYNFAQDGLKDAVVTYKDGMVEIQLATGETIKLTEEQWAQIQQWGIESKGVKDDVVGYIKEISGTLDETGDSGEQSAEKTKTGWISAGASIIDKFTPNTSNGVKGAITGAFGGIQTSSDTSANNTKKSWLQTGKEIIDKFTPNTSNAVKGAVTGALLDIENTSETTSSNTKKNMIDKMKEAIEEMKRLIDYWKPSTKTIKFKADTTELTKGVEGAIQGLLTGTISLKFSSGGRHGAKGLLIGPHLASGGIINRVGRGVPVGSAIAGERGREAVLPLTDSQQMAYLGREIAKNIVVNLTNITELDGRQIAIATSKAINEMNFASNGGVI